MPLPLALSLSKALMKGWRSELANRRARAQR
jgi:hypothetical protein